MMITVSGFGEALRSWREACALSRAQAAHVLSASPESLVRWENAVTLAAKRKRQSVVRVHKPFVTAFEKAYVAHFKEAPKIQIIGGA